MAAVAIGYNIAAMTNFNQVSNREDKCNTAGNNLQTGINTLNAGITGDPAASLESTLSEVLTASYDNSETETQTVIEESEESAGTEEDTSSATETTDIDEDGDGKNDVHISGYNTEGTTKSFINGDDSGESEGNRKTI